MLTHSLIELVISNRTQEDRYAASYRYMRLAWQYSMRFATHQISSNLSVCLSLTLTCVWL